ncbi:hypothetical protein JCM4814A_07770 [Streptomyces phaeofaciens JCM 4814]|uniref:Uncharacterized protein n=1 Tax=Streptomyces phaeofaciens TaxID=68254 RepID=A0A918HHS2_9ACTN|nr:hypothetical protein [Streptomyces phaeofaciens]GGT65977.1 hypothetical protein GCM10010226_49670 [Streptomyces phaeofaciens]
MICPHCHASLLLKERAGQVCATCERPFALDPKVHGRGMHDTRIRRVAEKLTDGGRRKVTVTQFGYLARTAHHTWPKTPESGRRPWVGRVVGTVLAAGLVALAFLVADMPSAGLVWWGSAGAAVLLYVVARGKPYRPARRAGAHLSPSPSEFRTMICGRWVQVYGSLPPGIVDDRTYRTPDEDSRDSRGTGRRTGGEPRSETVALLCPDPAVRVFLAANGFPRRLNLTVAAELEELTGTGPVVVLHDASASGLQLVADARASRPGQVVVDAGLPVRAVAGDRRVLTLHEEPPAHLRTEPPAWLRRMEEHAPRDAAWLVEGWFSPVAAAPPALVESAVERAVDKARGASDGEQDKAAAVGFMTWPRPAEPPAKDGN